MNQKRLSNPDASFDSWEGQVTHAYLSRKKEQEAGRPYDTVSESKKLAGFIKRAGKVYLDLTSHQQETFAAIEREAERLKKQQELEKKLVSLLSSSLRSVDYSPLFCNRRRGGKVGEWGMRLE